MVRESAKNATRFPAGIAFPNNFLPAGVWILCTGDGTVETATGGK
jgi:hypothetical protein